MQGHSSRVFPEVRKPPEISSLVFVLFITIYGTCTYFVSSIKFFSNFGKRGGGGGSYISIDYSCYSGNPLKKGMNYAPDLWLGLVLPVTILPKKVDSSCRSAFGAECRAVRPVTEFMTPKFSRIRSVAFLPEILIFRRCRFFAASC